MGKLSNLRQQKQHRNSTWQETGINLEELSGLAGPLFTHKNNVQQKQKKERGSLLDKEIIK